MIEWLTKSPSPEHSGGTMPDSHRLPCYALAGTPESLTNLPDSFRQALATCPKSGKPLFSKLQNLPFHRRSVIDIEAIEKMIASEPLQTNFWRSAPYRSYTGAWPTISESPSPSSSSTKVNFWGWTVLQGVRNRFLHRLSALEVLVWEMSQKSSHGACLGSVTEIEPEANNWNASTTSLGTSS
jgi:hypothetical protein